MTALSFSSSRLTPADGKFDSPLEFREGVDLMQLVCMGDDQQMLDDVLKQKHLESVLYRASNFFFRLKKATAEEVREDFELTKQQRKKFEEIVQKRYQSPEEFAARFKKVKELCYSIDFCEEFVKKILSLDLHKLLIVPLRQKYNLPTTHYDRSYRDAEKLKCISIVPKSWENAGSIVLNWNSKLSISYNNSWGPIRSHFERGYIWGGSDDTNKCIGLAELKEFHHGTISALLYPMMQTIRVIEKRENWVIEVIRLLSSQISKDVSGIISQYCFISKSLPKTVEQLHEDVGEPFVEKPTVTYYISNTDDHKNGRSALSVGYYFPCVEYYFP